MNASVIDYRQPWDAVIIGAGPAGATLALLAARRGMRVMLVDRAAFPRPKVCGGCLNARGASILAAIGLEQALVHADGQQLDQVVFCRGRRQVVVPGPCGVVVDRARFDDALARAAVAAGASFLDGTAATVQSHSDDSLRTICLQGADSEEAESATARVVIAADGLQHGSLRLLPRFRSTISHGSRVGLGILASGASPLSSHGYAAGTLTMAVVDDGYLGVARLRDGRFCIGAAVDPLVTRRPDGLAAWFTESLGACGLPAIDGLANSTVKGSPLLTRRNKSVAGQRLFLLGDAAGYTEPITGEGMTWALAGAAALAPIVAKACRQWRPMLADDWRQALNNAVGRRRRVNLALAAAFRRPLSSKLLFAAARAFPPLTRSLARTLNQPWTPHEAAA